jgi:hypothetical protein
MSSPEDFMKPIMTAIVTAAFVMAMLAARSTQAQAYKEKVLHSFIARPSRNQNTSSELSAISSQHSA